MIYFKYLPDFCQTAHTGAIEHFSPILIEQSTYSNKRGSFCIDLMIFTLRNEVLCPSRNVLLTLLRHVVFISI